MATRDVIVRIVERVENSGATKRVENDLRKLGPAGDVAAKGLDRLTTALTSRLGAAGGSAKKTLDSIGTSAISSGGAIGVGVAAGATVAAAALADLAKNGIEAFLNLTAQARQVQRVTGATAEEASTLAAVMRHLGIDVDAGAVAFGKLEKTVGTNAKALHDQGVQVDRNADGSTNFADTLANISDAYNGTTDQAKKAAIASSAFGRGYITLIPLLSKSRDELRALGDEADKHHLVFDQKQLDAGKDLTLQLRSLHEATTGLEVNLGEGLVPTLTNLTAGMTQVVEKTDSASSSVGGLGGILHRVTEVVPGLNVVVPVLERIGKGSGDAARKTAEHAQAMADAEQAAKDEADALAADVKAIHDQVNATLDAGDAQDKLGTALDNLAKAQAEDKTADIAAATSDLTDAQLSQEQAANRLSDAQDRLNELKTKDLSLELRRAQLADRRAQQNAKEAVHTRDQAQAELDRLRGDTASTPEQIAKAQDALEEATLSVDEANQSAADSAKAVTDLQNPKDTKEYRDAVLDVKTAQQGVAAANEAVAAAQKKVNDARAHDNTADVTRATRDVQRAMENIGKAGGTIDEQIAAYQRLFNIVPPQFRGFINDRIAELKALQYQAGLTKGQLEQLQSIFAPITGAAPPPADPKQPGVAAVIGGVIGGPAPAPTPSGGTNSGPANQFQSYTDGRTIINIDTLQAHDYADFRRQMDDQRRLNALAS